MPFRASFPPSWRIPLTVEVEDVSESLRANSIQPKRSRVWKVFVSVGLKARKPRAAVSWRKRLMRQRAPDGVDVALQARHDAA